MKDEIKEILKDSLYNGLTIEYYKELLDYITNLQEENVVLKSQLLQDNKSYYDMQDRIKKAIEYTERFTNGKTSRIDTFENVELVLETILQILKGE